MAAEGNVTVARHKDARLELSLAQSTVKAGQDLQLHIKAPYPGAGLITIERDEIYAHRWFKTKGNATVVPIRAPPNFEGNGYVVVTLARETGSTDVYSDPLSYAVATFRTQAHRRAVKLELAVPSTAKPGEPLPIELKADRPVKAVVFAVDEGILQVARYQTPDPLAHFFRQRALEVATYQTLDQLLPDLRHITKSAPGGGSPANAAAANLNPFKRHVEKPVAYWSGIVQAGPAGHQFTYVVPEHFDGTLRVMAVAVESQAIGSAATKARVRGDFVISPNAPTFVAPGDEFDLSVAVANMIQDGPTKVPVKLRLETSDHLALSSDAEQVLEIEPQQQATAIFKLRATSALGSGQVRLLASALGRSRRRSASLSVRPAAPFVTTV